MTLTLALALSFVAVESARGQQDEEAGIYRSEMEEAEMEINWENDRRRTADGGFSAFIGGLPSADRGRRT
jgi:putative alpha-1,2-mannosidase